MDNAVTEHETEVLGKLPVGLAYGRGILLGAHSLDKDPDGLQWPTVSKIRNVMSQIYAHAQRRGLIPDDVKYNPVRPPEFGGARCRSESDYTAVILTSRQTFQILNSMPLLQQTMVVLDAATGLRYSEIAGLQWLDIDWKNNQIHVRRRWIRGNVDRPKSRKSAAPVAMAPLLARHLRAWQMESRYTNPTDWVFASDKTHGRTPRVGNMLCRDHLRPAAIKAGVKLEKGQRFGFHNLRHSLHRSSLRKRRPMSKRLSAACVTRGVGSCWINMRKRT